MTFTDKLRSFYLECLLHLRVLFESITAFIKFVFLNKKDSIVTVGRLSATVIHKDGVRENKGLISTKVVTTAGVNYLVDGLQANTTDVALFKFHGSGTGAVAENIANTALGAESGSRVTGTQTEGASANIYKTVATVSYTSTLAITEHGIFSASTAGTLLDRSVFTAINVINGDSIEFTYELTLPAGS